MKRDTKEEFINKAIKIHKNNYDYSLVQYIRSKSKVIIICRKHKEFSIRPNDHLNGQGCPECKKETLSKLKKHTINNFLIKANKIHNYTYDYSQSIYNGTGINIKIICKKHGIFKQTPHNHLTGQGCPTCKFEFLSNYNKSTKEEFINKSIKIHKDNNDYSLVEYIKSKSKVKIICKKCNNIYEQKPNSHLLGNSCPKCKSSKGEIKILNYLIENSISFIHQKTFNGCKNKQLLQFDFYLPDYNTCIEYDGKQHYESIDFFGGEIGFKNTQIRDNIKNNFCKNNNIIMIRITYKDFKNIKTILNKHLKTN